MRIPKLLPPFESLEGSIGIGANDTDLDSWRKILQAYKNLHSQFPTISLSIYTKKRPSQMRNLPPQLNIEMSNDPATALLRDLKAKHIRGAIRGSLPSSEFLHRVGEEFSAPTMYRIALLASAGGHPFWFAPVGIDEGLTYEERQRFVAYAVELLAKCQVTPNIGILSKGRAGDAERGGFIKESLESNQKLVDELRRQYPYAQITHDEILLEQVVSEQRNFVLAPDGVSGNLIYRTLVHLGQGKAYGALYCDLLSRNFTVVDTSRTGNLEEVEGAMVLALTF